MVTMAYFILLVCLVAGSFAEDPEINMNVVREYIFFAAILNCRINPVLFIRDGFSWLGVD